MTGSHERPVTVARRACAVLLVLCLGLLTACSQGSGRSSTDGAPTWDGAAATPSDPATADDDDETTTHPRQAEQSEEPTGEATGAPLQDGALTALLIGTDSRDGDLGGMSDVIVLAQLSEDRDHLTLVSIARDSYVPIPGHGQDKINAAFAEGGIPLLRETVSDLMGGLEIDFAAQTNFEMFIALTRWMDGFWVNNQHASTVSVGSTGRQVVFEEGRIFLENTDGLIYVRERKSLPLGDLDRTERHRAALVGMMERLAEIREDEPTRLVELLPMLYRNVKLEGDLRPEQLLTLVEVGSELDRDDVTSLMVPVSHFSTTSSGAWINILDEARTRELAEGLRKGDVSGYVERYGTAYAPTDG